MLIGVVSGCKLNSNNNNTDKNENSSLELHYSFDEPTGNLAKESVSGKDYKINYVFNEENAADLFKEPNDPLKRTGVKGNSLYMDGFSNEIINRDFETPDSAITLSAWVAPRVFENIVYYDGNSMASFEFDIGASPTTKQSYLSTTSFLNSARYFSSIQAMDPTLAA